MSFDRCAVHQLDQAFSASFAEFGFIGSDESKCSGLIIFSSDENDRNFGISAFLEGGAQGFRGDRHGDDAINLGSKCDFDLVDHFGRVDTLRSNILAIEVHGGSSFFEAVLGHVPDGVGNQRCYK